MKSYMINNTTKERVTFQYNPETMPYGRTANYSSIESPGLSYPITQYTSGSAREFSFDIFMHDKPYSGKIDNMRRFLLELLPPEDNAISFFSPPSFTLAYGYFVKECVLISLDITDTELNSDGNPTVTTFSLSVRQI